MILKCTNVSKSFGKKKILNNISFEIEEGDIFGFIGPNGAGKTTTFYMVVGLVRHDQGKITIDGDDISVLPMHERARRGIGYLPQEASIFRRLTVYENLMAVLEIRKDLTAEQRRERADELIDEFNISHIRDSLGQSLSGGERRRVEIARALAANPKFIFNVPNNLFPFSCIKTYADFPLSEFPLHLSAIIRLQQRSNSLYS